MGFIPHSVTPQRRKAGPAEASFCGETVGSCANAPAGPSCLAHAAAAACHRSPLSPYLYRNRLYQSRLTTRHCQGRLYLSWASPALSALRPDTLHPSLSRHNTEPVRDPGWLTRTLTDWATLLFSPLEYLCKFCNAHPSHSILTGPWHDLQRKYKCQSGAKEALPP